MPQKRSELSSSLWSSCDELRGGMDASQYKDDAQARRGIFIVDATSGFMKDGPKNRLRAQDIHRVVDVFNKRLDVPKYARMVPLAGIEKNDFNLFLD